MAIAYDFDGTLAPGYMQARSFIPEVGIKDPARFWGKAKEYARKNDMDEILAYMQLMIQESIRSDKSIRRKTFVQHGKKISFFKGVEEWFNRINIYAKERGIKIEHFIISSGLREMIEGTSIARNFKYIFASGFMYDEADGIALWPALAVNYTSKTQYLFRINKGIMNSYDNEKINKFMPDNERPIPFTNIIYIGDGETDIPAMKMTKYNNGHAIAVYDQGKRKTKNKKPPKEIAQELLKHQRANYFAAADYSEGRKLDLIVKGIIDRVALNNKLVELK